MENIIPACTLDTVVFTGHVRKRMKERDINYDDVVLAITNGEIIEQYQDDKPYPSCLILGYSGKEPIHVCLSLDNGVIWMITTYIPTLDKWEEGFKIRKVVKLI
jgi:hypothetical protein